MSGRGGSYLNPRMSSENVIEGQVGSTPPTSINTIDRHKYYEREGAT